MVGERGRRDGDEMKRKIKYANAGQADAKKSPFFLRRRAADAAAKREKLEK